MNPYIEMKQRHQAEVNAFPMKFAFTQESLERGMRELGLDPKRDMKKIVAIPGGGFIRESDKQAFLDLAVLYKEALPKTQPLLLLYQPHQAKSKCKEPKSKCLLQNAPQVVSEIMPFAFPRFQSLLTQKGCQQKDS